MKKLNTIFRICIILHLIICFNFLNAQISGTVFRDYNYNGKRDSTSTVFEPRLCDITVNVYPNIGSSQTSVTDAFGKYSFSGLTFPVRIEFILPDMYEHSAVFGSNSNSSVQFYNLPTVNADFGVSYSDYFTSENPDVIVPVYISGYNLGKTDRVLSRFPYNNDGYLVNYFPTTSQNSSWPAPTNIASANDIGASYGVAYHKKSNSVFIGSYLKYATSFGPGGIGAIYKLNALSNTTSLFLDLNSYFGTPVAGIDPHPLSTNYFVDPSTSLTVEDTITHTKDFIGKRGLGDLDIDESTNTLYVMNLNDRKLYKIPIGNAGTAPGPGIITSYSVPLVNPMGLPSSLSVSNPNDVRPFGLCIHKGKVYVGLINTGESTFDGNFSADPENSQVDLWAWVYEFDPSTNTFAALPTVSMSLKYPSNYNSNGSRWNTWAKHTLFFASGPFSIYKDIQPMLTDIEILNDQMVLSFRDRKGDQINSPRTGIGGDIVRLCKDKTLGTWVVENNANACLITTVGQNNNQSFNNGEFFFDDYAIARQTNFRLLEESVLGSTALLPIQNQIITTASDPGSIGSNGTEKFDMNTGVRKGEYDLYSIDVTPMDSTFGKSNGIGDIEILGSIAPLEIGNRVWLDTNNDGIQDPNESPIQGVTVELRKADNTLIATAITDANGNYYFSNATGTDAGQAKYGLTLLVPNTSLKVVIPNVQGGSKQSALGTNTLTTANIGGSGQSDVRDSDGILSGNDAVVSFTTGDPGANDHTFDFGFNPVVASCVASITATPGSCVPTTNQYTLTGQITLTDPPTTGTLTIQIAGGGSQTFDLSSGIPTSYSIANQNADGASHSITLSISGSSCTDTKLFTAPVNCLVIPCPSPNCGTLKSKKVINN